MSVKKHVAEIMLLPEGDEPLLFTVTDAEKMREEIKLTDIQNGDKVLVYQKKKRIVLYRPSRQQIVDVLPLKGK